MSSFQKDATLEEERDKNENEMLERIRYMPTLPSTFNSLVGKAVKIETEESRCLIELLGDLLGITDYETNKAAFWFLDTVALQVLSYKNCLDDHCRGVLISWLAGEIKLIRDRKLSREDFFKKMRTFFLYMAKKLSSGSQLLHWELIVDKGPKILSQNSTIDESLENATEYFITNRSSDEKLTSESNAAHEVKPSIAEDDSASSVTNSLQRKPSQNSEVPLNVENSQIDTSTDAIKSSGLTHPNIALNAIIEATYSMYANELRYALIYAVFVMPIEVEIFHMPHTVRVPRQIKLADPEGGSFDLQLRNRLERVAYESTSGNGKKHKEIKINNANRERAVKEDLNTKLPPTPVSSLIDEEILANNRRFILPLIEAREAAQIYEMHVENMKDKDKYEHN